VQIYYERELRPAEKRHAPWVERVTGQVHAAYGALEAEFRRRPPAAGAAIDQAGITTAVAWRFTRETVPDVVSPERCPTIAAYSAAAETLAEFKAAEHGLGTYPVHEGG
jgi:glutathione S-transferase